MAYINDRISAMMGLMFGRVVMGQRVSNPLWETLFEGEVTTAVNPTIPINGYIGNWSDSDSLMFVANEGIRITVNGASEIHTAHYYDSNINRGIMCGNKWLASDRDSAVADDGGNYYAGTVYSIGIVHNYLITREPGTYQVKIERALFEPVAYLYNGARLPKLPRTKYPYMWIRGVEHSDGTVKYYLRAFSEPLVYKYDSVLSKSYVISNTGTGSLFDNENGDWVLFMADVELGNYFPVDSFVHSWVNHDVISKEDGTVYLAASDPVPIYE